MATTESKIASVPGLKASLRELKDELDDLKKEREKWESLLRNPTRSFDCEKYRFELQNFHDQYMKMSERIQSNESFYTELCLSSESKKDEMVEEFLEDVKEILTDDLVNRKDAWLNYLYQITMVINFTFRGYFGLSFFNRWGYFIDKDMSRTIHSYAYPSYADEFSHTYPMKWVLLLDEFTRFIESLPKSVLQRIWQQLSDDQSVLDTKTQSHKIIRFLFQLFHYKRQQKNEIYFKFKKMEIIHLVWDINHNLKKYLKSSDKLTKDEFEMSIGTILKQTLNSFHEDPGSFVNTLDL